MVNLGYVWRFLRKGQNLGTIELRACPHYPSKNSLFGFGGDLLIGCSGLDKKSSVCQLSGNACPYAQRGQVAFRHKR